MRFVSTLLVSMITATVSAQIGPGIVTSPVPDSFFTPAHLSRFGIYRAGATDRRITSVQMTKTPGIDGPGQYTVALTLYDLAPQFGGSPGGGEAVVLGQYDTTTQPPSLTLNADARALIDPANGPCVSLKMEPRDAICCAIDQADGIYFSLRTSVRVPFPKPIKVTHKVNTAPVPAAGYVQAVPCFYDGVLVMIYADRQNQIIMRQLELQFDPNNNLTAAELQDVNVVTRVTGRPHSPTPILDGDGDVWGLWLGIALGTDSDMFFQSLLTTQDVPQRVFESPGFMRGGSVAGGRFYFTEAGVVYRGEGAWLIGSDNRLGTAATLTVGCRNPRAPQQPCVSLLAASAAAGSGVMAPVSLPGTVGGFALRLPIQVFHQVVASGVDEVTGWTRPVPVLPALRGLRISVQGLSLPPGGLPVWTNTTTLTFR